MMGLLHWFGIGVAVIVSLKSNVNCMRYAEPRREFFYVGGEYAQVTVGNSTTQIMMNQIYVEKLTPPSASKDIPIVFITGAAQTSTNFLETPDGRPGWTSYFLSQGYTVYISDQPSRGRSPWYPSIGSIIFMTTSDIENRFTATSSHDLWPQSKLHTQWPGTGKVGDPVFDAFYAAQIQYQGDRSISEEQNAKAYTALLDKIGKSHVITHSQAGPYGWRVGDLRPNLVKSIVALEPSGPPFIQRPPTSGPDRKWGITDLEVAYEPTAGPNGTLLERITVPAKDSDHYDCVMQRDPPKKLKNFANIPILIVTAEASYHATYDYCTAAYLEQAGANVKHLELGDEGIHGNGHMIFMEKNNIEVAEKVHSWLGQQ